MKFFLFYFWVELAKICNKRKEKAQKKFLENLSLFSQPEFQEKEGFTKIGLVM